MGYREVYAGWQANPEAFWMDAASKIDWVNPPSKALNDSRAPLYEWFTDAQRQHLLERGGPACAGRARRSVGDHP